MGSKYTKQLASTITKSSPAANKQQTAYPPTLTTSTVTTSSTATVHSPLMANSASSISSLQLQKPHYNTNTNSRPKQNLLVATDLSLEVPSPPEIISQLLSGLSATTALLAKPPTSRPAPNATPTKTPPSALPSSPPPHTINHYPGASATPTAASATSWHGKPTACPKVLPLATTSANTTSTASKTSKPKHYTTPSSSCKKN